MKIKPLEISVADLATGYSDDGDDGVVAYNGNLDVRPPHQRNFVYDPPERNAVINSVWQGFPLNVMYWADRDDGTFEIIDGQQRTISICQYIDGDFSIPVGDNPHVRAFHNLQPDEQNRILNYKLMVYICTGTASQRLDWFKTINIAGKVLTRQELRNAVYHGQWVTDAKRYFSRPGCPAQGVASNLLNGKVNRQEYLETAIRWMNDGDVEGYMSKHQHDKNAVALWNHFRSVIDWVNATFTTYRKFMKGVEWGPLYNRFKDADLDPVALETETRKLMMDDDVTSKSGIYPYLLDDDQRHLNIRAFTDAMKADAFERQNGVCPTCKESFSIDDMDGDHIDPWSKGGKTTADNCQMLCKPCNRRKGAK